MIELEKLIERINSSSSIARKFGNFTFKPTSEGILLSHDSGDEVLINDESDLIELLGIIKNSSLKDLMEVSIMNCVTEKIKTSKFRNIIGTKVGLEFLDDYLHIERKDQDRFRDILEKLRDNKSIEEASTDDHDGVDFILSNSYFVDNWYESNLNIELFKSLNLSAYTDDSNKSKLINYIKKLIELNINGDNCTGYNSKGLILRCNIILTIKLLLGRNEHKLLFSMIRNVINIISRIDYGLIHELDYYMQEYQTYIDYEEYRSPIKISEFSDMNLYLYILIGLMNIDKKLLDNNKVRDLESIDTIEELIRLIY